MTELEKLKAIQPFNTDVPENAVVAGTPARIIRYLEKDEIE